MLLAFAGAEYAIYSHFVDPLPAAGWAGWVGEWASAPIVPGPGGRAAAVPDRRATVAALASVAVVRAGGARADRARGRARPGRRPRLQRQPALRRRHRGVDRRAVRDRLVARLPGDVRRHRGGRRATAVGRGRGARAAAAAAARGARHGRRVHGVPDRQRRHAGGVRRRRVRRDRVARRCSRRRWRSRSCATACTDSTCSSTARSCSARSPPCWAGSTSRPCSASEALLGQDVQLGAALSRRRSSRSPSSRCASGCSAPSAGCCTASATSRTRRSPRSAGAWARRWRRRACCR